MSPEEAAAAVFRPALADFDAMIVMRRDSLPSADLALQSADGSKRNVEAELRRAGFGGDEEGEPLDKRARAVLRTIPAGKKFYDAPTQPCRYASSKARYFSYAIGGDT